MNFQLLTEAAPADLTSQLATFLPLILIFVVFYFFLIRPQKKREKETQKMRSTIEVGDEIVTIGGIIGTVVSSREDMLVIETGGDRNKVRITRWAVQQNNTAHDAPAAEKK